MYLIFLGASQQLNSNSGHQIGQQVGVVSHPQRVSSDHGDKSWCLQLLKKKNPPYGRN